MKRVRVYGNWEETRVLEGRGKSPGSSWRDGEGAASSGTREMGKSPGSSRRCKTSF